MLNNIISIKVLANELSNHGSPYDRGMADSYYQRPHYPHKMIDGKEVPLERGSAEWVEYEEGYEFNEELGHFKDWGQP